MKPSQQIIFKGCKMEKNRECCIIIMLVIPWMYAQSQEPFLCHLDFIFPCYLLVWFWYEGCAVTQRLINGLFIICSVQLKPISSSFQVVKSAARLRFTTHSDKLCHVTAAVYNNPDTPPMLCEWICKGEVCV